MSDMDYLNILPDMDRMDIEESSFLKSTSFILNNGNKLDNSQGNNDQQLKQE